MYEFFSLELKAMLEINAVLNLQALFKILIHFYFSIKQLVKYL